MKIVLINRWMDEIVGRPTLKLNRIAIALATMVQEVMISVSALVMCT